MRNKFDLEQAIMNCWSVIDDLKVVREAEFESEEDFKNTIAAIEVIYELKFQKLQDSFEASFS